MAIARLQHAGIGVLVAGLLLACSAIAQDRVAESIRLKSEGKWAEALQALREEVANPRLTNDPDTHITNVRQNLLITLAEYVGLHGFDEKSDEEARRIYQDGLSAARGNKGREAILDNGIVVYYSKTYRNGLALPYMRRELQHWLNAGDGFRSVLGYHAVYSAYVDMGEFTLARHYAATALDAAKAYFILGSRPTAVNEWVQYWVILGELMNLAAQRGELAEVERLWLLREPISGRYWNSNAVSLAQAAAHFGMAGDGKRSIDLLAKSQAAWEGERSRFNENVRRLTEITMACTEGDVRLHARDFRAAVAAYERCDGLFRQSGQKDVDISQTVRGAAYEGAGDLDRASRAYQIAIDGVEKTRGSYTLAERANIFRTILRRPYWGQIRVAARLAAAGDSARFFQALQTSELVRARQLGELLDPEAARRVSAESLAQMQKRLRPEEVILAYTVTERDIVLLTMGTASARSILIPYEPRDFRELARATARDLARPESRVDGLNAKLAQLGKLLVGPVAADLAGKKRITVLTDGLMNLVPFELLSYAPEGYRPLYRDYIVVNSPSLLFIEHAGRARRGGKPANLLALADPSYPRQPELANLAKEDAAIAARGSRYLSYFTALPETRTEVQAIGGMFAGEKVQLLVGEQAVESVVKKADFAGYQYLHFATHGVIGNEVPGLREPALVLGNEPGEDGFLTMSEVAKLKLDAEITVLSACNTGSGEFVEGEGVMGMSRAFLGAGSRSVVVSLWPVASKATERLMVAFYRNLRGGKDAAASLREAKLELIEQAQKSNPTESHPFFWAPFILLGG